MLVVPRRDHEASRYQAPEPLDFVELERFASVFREYFEGDGRHHVWFSDVASSSLLVYDNHDLIYSYGNDDEIISLLRKKGFTEGNPRIPDPHTHHYNDAFDWAEDEIMRYFNWRRFPLQEEHDIP
ncbi:MAG: hypothetical protein IT364_27435 [Candidatus Hydrogenedentes bacterium]|nr:hypothetical protein [Candidatus Hydrogenedentota bacterium]